MSRSVEAVQRELLSLLPPGWVWPKGEDSLLAAILKAFAEGMAEIEETAEAMMRQVDPRTATICLTDFERVLGSDPCVPDQAALPVADRQKIAHSRWTARGGASRAYFTAIAGALGYDITIREFRPFMAGWSRAGDARWQAGTPLMRHFWRVNVPGARLSWFRAGQGRAGNDPLLKISRAEDLECRLQRQKPAHTILQFSYEGA